VYPYEYVDSVERFSEIQLLLKETFYAKLNESECLESINMEYFRDHHDLNSRTDVLHLADIFENFRDLCMKNYKIDPLWSSATPGLAMDGCMKQTKVKLEIRSDYDMLLKYIAGTHGSISSIMHRHAVANNKYMENYGKSKESSFIVYLDAKNLYGWAVLSIANRWI
jgi:hypothetical protein